MGTMQFNPEKELMMKISSFLDRNSNFYKGPVSHIGKGISRPLPSRSYEPGKEDSVSECNFYRFQNVSVDIPKDSEDKHLYLHGKNPGQIGRHYSRLVKLAKKTDK